MSSEQILEVEIPEGIEVTLTEDSSLIVKGPLGEVRKRFNDPRASLSKGENSIAIRSRSQRKKSAAMVNTYRAHLRNMFQGVNQGFTYEMQIIYSHFPMRVNFKGGEVLIQNFLGERSPRKATIFEGVDVKVQNERVILKGIDKEKVGQSAANIERATKIKRKDPRVFQDGIYIVGGAR